MGIDDLGEKMGTQVFAGNISIEFYEDGLKIKPYSKEEVRLSRQETEMLFEAIEKWRNRLKLLEDT